MTIRPRRIAVTGADGFVGRHVVQAAAARGYDVVAITRSAITEEGLAHLVESNVVADLTETWPQVQADAIVHLAGLAAVGRSFDEPQRYIEANTRMVTALGEGLLAEESDARVVIVSSGSVYEPHGDAPVTESMATAATSPYGISKLAVEAQGDYYRRRGLDVVIARPFNHIGPGQAAGFLVPDLTAALRELPDASTLPAGNLETARDYTDVRDVAAAYLDLVDTARLRHHTYNVATGVSRSGVEMLQLVCNALDRAVPEISVDPNRLRANEVSRVRGSAERLTRDTGWRPQISIERSIRDFVDGGVAP